jgi:hypothetical protein
MGQDVMMQSDLSEEEETRYRFIDVRPWFRLTPCPEL